MAGRSDRDGTDPRLVPLSEDGSYPVPAREHRVEEVVRRSRFLAVIARAPDPGAAQELVRSLKGEFPDATHHCWAFVSGPPGSTARIGQSDDGEPHGTAGKPILNTLLHSGVGEVVAVVTRWFGGVKLGKGGLGRAYAGAVGKALVSLPIERRVEWVAVRIQVGFSGFDPLYRQLESIPFLDRRERYTPAGLLHLEGSVPSGDLERLRQAVAEFTAGEGRVELSGEEP